MRADAVHAPLHRGALVMDALFADSFHLPIYTGTSQGSIISTISASHVPAKKKNNNNKHSHNHQQVFCERKPASALLSN